MNFSGVLITKKFDLQSFNISCQTTNYHFFAKYCRYFLDTCTLSYQGIKCQIELIIYGDLKLKTGESWLPKLSFGVGYYLDTFTMSYQKTRCPIEILKNAVLKMKKGKSKLLDSPFPVGI